ncbi:MAG: UDP-3-O-(3-hydroxymyristoyl)glucosamine N-acyltransferase [Ignavibacteria bacterium]|jgi:UDP-3-O-[3-hydroxymyristoyl] glucosamine N-acyltransferase|nr:UDP-3-O-(3-hydroxymyristoyl)glucosamine N-acyltransferase [Ignavibacteria bacterium]
MTVKTIAEIIGGTVTGNPDIIIMDAGKIETAGPEQIAFISNPQYAKFFNTTSAGAVIVSEEFDTGSNPNNITVIRVRDPYLAFVKLLEEFGPKKENQYGISGFCSVGKDTEFPENVLIDDFVKIGSGCRIGGNTLIYSNTTIGSNVEIGANCIIYGNVTVYDGCRLGNNVIIHSNAVIGSDGFGFAKDADGKFKKIPQNGIVVIEDDVEIGSSTTIDRATIGETRICRGVKLDNQIQVAHNVIIGEDTVIAAQVGISGSAKIGKRCMIGGQSGLVGHITICDDVIIGAAVGVSKSISKPGVYLGYRGKPMRESLREDAMLKELPLLKDRIKELENKINNKS